MRNYIQYIKIFIQNSMQKEMAFRLNFFISCLHTLLNLLGGIGGILIFFNQKQTLNGWNFSETLALLGIYLFIQAIKNLFIGPSLESLAGLNGDLWSGKFDFILLKPLPTQFYVSFRNWRIWTLFDLLVSIVLICIALFQLQVQILGLQLLCFFLALIISLSLVYSILLILSTTAFWYLGTPLIWIYNSLIQMGRFPIGIYPGFLKMILTWVIPIGVIVTVPAKLLIDQIEFEQLIAGAVLAVGFFMISTIFFKISLKRYASASS